MHTNRRFRATTIAETLRAQGRTVTWLSRQLGLSRQYTSDVVNGRRDCNLETAERIVALLGVPLFVGFDSTVRTEAVQSVEVA